MSIICIPRKPGWGTICTFLSTRKSSCVVRIKKVDESPLFFWGGAAPLRAPQAAPQAALRLPQAASGCLRLPQAPRPSGCLRPPGPHTLRLPHAPRVETLGYDWEEAVRRLAPVLESGLKSAASGHPCPSGSVLRVLPPTWEALWAGGLTV